LDHCYAPQLANRFVQRVEKMRIPEIRLLLLTGAILIGVGLVVALFVVLVMKNMAGRLIQDPQGTVSKYWLVSETIIES
jgi:hypothetical protein